FRRHIIFSAFFFSCIYANLFILSFPTRRSSDLGFRGFIEQNADYDALIYTTFMSGTGEGQEEKIATSLEDDDLKLEREVIWEGRSEEHTSELQSRFDLVCRLLLEKKKKKCTRNK